VTWRLFYVYDFCHEITSPSQPCQRVYRDSLLLVNLTIVYVKFSKLAKKLAKNMILAKKEHFVNIKLILGTLHCLLFW
jgi:hypothetical protein